MSQSVSVDLNLSKEEKYKTVLPQINELISHENDLIANFANISAVLKSVFGFFWVGFYIVKHEELVLGPFQGDVACTRIAKGKGVCGTAWQKQETIVVPDVNLFPGHIACSALSKSEIVVPVFNSKNQVFAVLDIDSSEFNDFDEIDQKYLEKMLHYFKTNTDNVAD
jgi:L-methionine (R)-S-oxide reductase